MMRWVLFAWFASLLVGCSAPSSLIATPTPLTCGGTPLNPPDNLVCLQINSNTSVIQSQNNAQVIIRSNRSIITLNGTLYVQRNPDRIQVAVLQGLAILSVGRSTRILQIGSQADMILASDSDDVAFVSDAVPIAWDTFRTLPLTHLPRQIQLPTPAPTPFICAPPEEWTGTYTVQPGDSLIQIAPRYGLTVGELVRGNCIEDANRLNVGQTLRVPDIATRTPAPA